MEIKEHLPKPLSTSTASKSPILSENTSKASNLNPLPSLSPTPRSKDDDKLSSSFFGVRNYLHHFYDSVALRDADQFEEFEEYR